MRWMSYSESIALGKLWGSYRVFLCFIFDAELLSSPVGVYLRDDWLAPRATREIDRYLDQFVDKASARKYSGDQPCLIDDLIRKGKGRGNIKNAVISTLLAGKDPSTTTLAWAYYEIARHPHVFAKMKAEVKEQ